MKTKRRIEVKLPYPRVRPEGDPNCPIASIMCECGRTIYANLRPPFDNPDDIEIDCACGRLYLGKWSEWHEGWPDASKSVTFPSPKTES